MMSVCHEGHEYRKKRNILLEVCNIYHISHTELCIGMGSWILNRNFQVNFFLFALTLNFIIFHDFSTLYSVHKRKCFMADMRLPLNPGVCDRSSLMEFACPASFPISFRREGQKSEEYL
jgi:hypothetical protein